MMRATAREPLPEDGSLRSYAEKEVADPGTSEWLRAIRESIADGAIQSELAAQLSYEELLDEWRARRS
jgi:hypothetical protein